MKMVIRILFLPFRYLAINNYFTQSLTVLWF